MQIEGIYPDVVAGDPPATIPERLRIHGTTEEWERLGPFVPKGHEITPPARKWLVRSIAREVEVQCDDQRLIDWMKQPGD